MLRQTLCRSWVQLAVGLCLAAAGSCFIAPLHGDDSAAVEVVGEELAPLVRQLEAAEFAQRQEASQKLAEMGSAALPQLEKTAQSDSREASSRALDILRRHWHESDGELKQSAEQALTRLATSGSTRAAQRASEILHPPKAYDPSDPVAFGRINPARIQIAGGFRPAAPFGNAPFGGNFRRITTRVTNGKRDVEVEENGRKIVMQTFPGGKIEVEITQPQNGRDVTRKVEAQSLEELKRKDPEAGAAYEQYNGPPAARIANQAPPPRALPLPATPPGAGALPVAPMPVVPEPNGGPREARRLGDRGGFGEVRGLGQRIPEPALPNDARRRMIQTMERQIEQMKAQLPDNPARQRTIELLESHKEQLRRNLER